MNKLYCDNLPKNVLDKEHKWFKREGNIYYCTRCHAIAELEPTTAVDWFYEIIRSHFEHDENFLKELKKTKEIAKEKERQQHGNTWDAAIQAHEDRGYVHERSLTDFDEYQIK